MSAPLNVTLDALSGKWELDKILSSPTDPLLSLQGMNWVVRKAIGMSSVVLDIKQTEETGATTKQPVTYLEISQTSSTGLPGTTEKRWFDWEPRNQEDHIFGKCVAQARWVAGIKSDSGRAKPDLEVQTTLVQDPNIGRFLSGEVNGDLSRSEGFLIESPDDEVREEDKQWVQLFIRSVDGNWTAEQVWGFEEVGNERRYVRRVVVANKKGEHGLARLVYSYRGGN
ncbi:hypothetical protein BJX65DRAFT_305682 [Aspergillus insuetus]